LKLGWKTAGQHIYIVLLLFVYQLLWGLVLYRTISSIVTPLLRRYPDIHPSDAAVNLFWAEHFFAVTRTGRLSPYLWLLLALFAVRMMLTPFINAGLLYSIHHIGEGGNTLFTAGVRRAWKRIGVLYAMQMALTLSPSYWIVQQSIRIYRESVSIIEMGMQIGLILAGWFLFGYLLHILFLYLQFSRIGNTPLLPTLWRTVKQIVPVLGLSCILLLIGSAVAATAAAVSLIWAGLAALVLHQAFHLIRSWIKVWTIASMYHLWKAKLGAN
jgi:hypothetical protein